MTTTSDREANYDLYAKEFFDDSSPTFNTALKEMQASFENHIADEYEFKVTNG